MYGKIIIKTAIAEAQISTNYHHSIYNFLIDNGYSHEESEDVASWADIAAIGEEYELHGAKIIIVGGEQT